MTRDTPMDAVATPGLELRQPCALVAVSERRAVVRRLFPKGVSGNPGGRPKALVDIVELARAHSPDAIRTLARIMEGEDPPPAARVAAANSRLDRAYWRPSQAVKIGERIFLEELVLGSMRHVDDGENMIGEWADQQSARQPRR